MSQPDPSQFPRPVEPVPYAGVATPNDALMTGSLSRAILVGGILLRLIGAYTLVECRWFFTIVVGYALGGFLRADLKMFFIGLLAMASIGWGLFLLLRGPRLIARLLRSVPPGALSAGAEWSVVALTAAGSVVLLWTLDPLFALYQRGWNLETLISSLAQLALGVWLVGGSPRLSRTCRPMR